MLAYQVVVDDGTAGQIDPGNGEGGMDRPQVLQCEAGNSVEVLGVGEGPDHAGSDRQHIAGDGAEDEHCYHPCRCGLEPV